MGRPTVVAVRCAVMSRRRPPADACRRHARDVAGPPPLAGARVVPEKRPSPRSRVWSPKQSGSIVMVEVTSSSRAPASSSMRNVSWRVAAPTWIFRRSSPQARDRLSVGAGARSAVALAELLTIPTRATGPRKESDDRRRSLSRARRCAERGEGPGSCEVTIGGVRDHESSDEAPRTRCSRCPRRDMLTR